MKWKLQINVVVNIINDKSRKSVQGSFSKNKIRTTAYISLKKVCIKHRSSHVKVAGSKGYMEFGSKRFLYFIGI